MPPISTGQHGQRKPAPNARGIKGGARVIFNGDGKSCPAKPITSGERLSPNYVNPDGEIAKEKNHEQQARCADRSFIADGNVYGYGPSGGAQRRRRFTKG